MLPEAFVPGTPLWIDSRPIWDGDGPWYARLVEQAVVVPGPATAGSARPPATPASTSSSASQEREPHGTTIYNTAAVLRARRSARSTSTAS